MGLADSSEQVNRIIKPNVCVLADHKGPVQGPFLFALWAPMRKAHFVNKVQLARKSRARLTLFVTVTVIASQFCCAGIKHRSETNLANTL